MDPNRNIEYLDYLSKQLAEFITAFDELMTHHVENTGIGSMAPGIAPAALPRDGADMDQVAELTDQLHRLSGSLMELSNVTSVSMMVEGHGRIDPFINWSAILQPKPLLDAPNVRGCAVRAAGRLESLRMKAEALSAPNIDSTLLHPLVWAGAQRLWNDGYFRQAVGAAAEAVTGQMKQLTGRNDAPETSLWQQAFSEADPEVDRPRLRWPGDPKDQTVKNINDALRRFAPGANMLIRNTATHVTEDIAEQVALEQLAAWSVLARFIDGCVVLRSEDELEAPQRDDTGDEA